MDTRRDPIPYGRKQLEAMRIGSAEEAEALVRRLPWVREEREITRTERISALRAILDLAATFGAERWDEGRYHASANYVVLLITGGREGDEERLRAWREAQKAIDDLRESRSGGAALALWTIQLRAIEGEMNRLLDDAIGDN